ncbi:MAG: carboxylase [Chitinophagaceae bacterium]
MSLCIIKAGLLDTIQDGGRWGYQHLGINTNGAMDVYAAGLANALLGKALSEAVIEMQFPAAQICFEQATIIAITGADFSPRINGVAIPLNHPVVVAKGSMLQFVKFLKGTRCYLSLLHSLQVESWLNSSSTNLKIAVGGFEGRRLQKEDVIPFINQYKVEHLLQNVAFALLPWKANDALEKRNKLQVVYGSEWHLLTEEAQHQFQHSFFQITNDADRMGYRLQGPALEFKQHSSLLSSAVNFGTIQALPNGQLIILMADHQTTGGYPKVAHVITADLSLLAQKNTNNTIQFKVTDGATAEEKLVAQQKNLRGLQIACKFRLEELL